MRAISPNLMLAQVIHHMYVYGIKRSTPGPFPSMLYKLSSTVGNNSVCNIENLDVGL